MEPCYTRIEEALETGYGTLVRESYFGFPNGRSNIYLVRDDMIVWEAELPMPDDVYANPIRLESGHFRCATWNGITCKVDLATGRIIESFLTK